ncbi:MAG: 3D domain-containing protein [Deltaproteobacteria bacterium]|nr:MAG: 3D domain-containing protein [Deltaproteobacteria bacterium]
MSSKKHVRYRCLIQVSVLIVLALISGCKTDKKHTAIVTATAYNSIPGQTTKQNHDIGAWGDKLKPGMKAIAVSRDLIKKGLTHNTKVKIEGLKGEYVVLDKMNKRWKKKIDIYMGTDVEAAREWGKRKVRITW